MPDTRFYLNGHLHRSLHLNRAKDKLTAFDYKDKKAKVYNWSDVRRNKQNAFTVTEVAEMLDKHRETIMRHLIEGNIERPQQEYSLDTGNPGRLLFSEDDVLEIHEFMSQIHIGRPRKDGKTTNNSLPSREQLKSILTSGRLLYVKEKGEFVPAWKASEW